VNEGLASLGVELDIVPHLVALLAAYVLALPIAWDRERNERSAIFWPPSPHADSSKPPSRSPLAMSIALFG